MFSTESWASVGRFADAARRYWVGVFPRVCREVNGWRQRAQQIPDPALRALALEAHRKRGNMEGASVFAAYAPRRHRRAAIAAAVAFQSAYNYLDILSEQPCARPVQNNSSLHMALLAALDPGAEPLDYYEHCPLRRDGGYLQAMIDRCRASLAQLPSAEPARAATIAAAERVIAFQSFNLAPRAGDHAMLAQWARAATPQGSGLRWWETAAAAGSSLGVHVLIAAAADRQLSVQRIETLERAYFPWIGALHSLLDALVDVQEDRRSGQRSLIVYYAGPAQAARRMVWLLRRSGELAAELPDGARHEIVLAAMTGMYLSSPPASAAQIAPVRAAILEALGVLAGPTLAVFSIRRRLSVLRRWARLRGTGGIGRIEGVQGSEISEAGCLPTAAEQQVPWGTVLPGEAESVDAEAEAQAEARAWRAELAGAATAADVGERPARSEPAVAGLWAGS